jgi:glucuronate isomerase
MLHPDRLLPPEPGVRSIARRLYKSVAARPIVSPHGHTDPRWFAEDEPFPNPAALFVTPDHYLFRMLYSQGVPLEALGIPRRDGAPVETDPRKVWRLFARHYYLFRGTPSRMWFDHALEHVFGIEDRLSERNADALHDRIEAALQRPEFRPRALFERFNIEAIATTESPLDPLEHQACLRDSGWRGRVVTAFRPDPVSIRSSPGSSRTSTGWARSPARTPDRGRATSPRPRTGGPTSRASARPRPTTAIRALRRPTCRATRRVRCSPRSGAALHRCGRSSCSAPRC